MAIKKADQKNLVVNQIIIKAPQRTTSDVGAWRNAMRSADNGRMKQLIDLYDDLYIDGILSDAVDKRIGAVVNSEITFQNEKGEEVVEMINLIDSLDFEELIKLIMHVRFYGRTGVEFDFSNGFKVHEIPKKYINLNNKIIHLNDMDERGVNYEEDDNILILGKPNDYGLFLKTAPFAIWKRGGFGDYAQWLEIFGMPQRIGKYSSYDPESRKMLEDALENAGSAPWVVIPKETDVETVNNTGNGSSGASFNEFRQACNEELLITLLGQTMTTVQGERGARALGEVHKDVEEGKNRSDMRYVQRVLNQYLLPLLEKRGYPVKGGRFVFPKSAEQLTVAEVVQLSDILEIPAYFLQEKYSIPAASEGEKIARREMPNYNDFSHIQTPEVIENVDKSFFMRLRDFFAFAPALTMTGATNRLTLSDSERNKLLTSTSLNDRIIGRIDGKGKFDVELFSFIANDLLKAVGSKAIELSDVGFEYNYQSDAFKTAQELNIFQFSAAKTLEEITQLNQIYRDSKSFEEFYKKSSELTGKFNKTWQKTEYETATNISAAHETYHRLKAKSHLFKLWEYRTVDDERVRKSHAEMHGIILPVNDQLWDKIYPPNGWKCRCYVVPRMEHEVPKGKVDESRRVVNEYLNSEEWQKVKKQGFGVNRALLPEIFDTNKMYVEKFVEKADKLMKNVNYKVYEMQEPADCRANSKSELEASKTVKEFEATLINENNKHFVKDYNNRCVQFDFEKWQKGHQGDKYEERPKLLNGLAEALATPDEVWINANSKNANHFNQYTYIKYYKDVAIVVNATIENGTVFRIKTWYPLAEYESSIMNKRYGILVYRKGQ